jgi:MFS family permease
MFSTQVGTRFVLDASFFEKVQKENVPSQSIEALRSLEGNSYQSAKEFLKAARTAVGEEAEKKFESILISSARSDNYYWIAVLLIAVAAASHQAWSANIFTLVSDVFPKKATASVIGIGGMVGAVAGLVADFSLGQLLSSSGPAGYFFAFLVAGSCYLIILGVVHVLMPRMTPLDENLRHVGE